MLILTFFETIFKALANNDDETLATFGSSHPNLQLVLPSND